MISEKNVFDKSNFSKYLLGILIFAFIFSSISSILFMSNKYNIIVGRYKKVNINEFISILNSEKRALASLNLTEEQIAQLNSKEFIISTLSKVLYSKLIDMEIDNFAIQEPKKLTMDTILLEEDFQIDGKLDIKKFETFLKKYNISEQDYIKILQESHNKKFLIDTIVATENINNYSLDILRSETNKYKNIELFLIEKDRLETYSGDVSEDEIKQYYNNNINNFILPEERRVDYIKIVNYTDDQINNIQTMKSKGKTIQEIAREMNIKIDTHGYLKKDDINGKKYQSLPDDLFEYAIGKVSRPTKIEKDMYFYSVADIRESRVKTIDEVRRDVKLAIQDKKTEEIRFKAVDKMIDKYKKDGYSSAVLASYGFTITNKDNIIKKSKDYNKDFLDNLMTTKKGDITNVFMDNKYMYFAFVKSEGVLTKNSEQYVDISSIKKDVIEKYNDELFRYYVEYLKDKKYKLRVNYKLLDLIR